MTTEIVQHCGISGKISIRVIHIRPRCADEFFSLDIRADGSNVQHFLSPEQADVFGDLISGALTEAKAKGAAQRTWECPAENPEELAACGLNITLDKTETQG